jgi:hypothetical protein
LITLIPAVPSYIFSIFYFIFFWCQLLSATQLFAFFTSICTHDIRKPFYPIFSCTFLLQTRPWLTSQSDKLSYTKVFFTFFFSFSHFPLSWGKANIFPFSPVCGYFKHSSYGYYEQVRLDCMVEMDQIGSKPTVVGAAPGF